MISKRTEDWWRISIEVGSAAEEAVAAMLEREFQKPATITVDFERGRILVAIYTSQFPQNRTAMMARLRQELRRIAEFGLDVAPAVVAIQKVAREDWRHSWKKHFKPFEVGKRLLVRPSWSQRRARTGQRVIVLDPGLSFGTGLHATTRYCLQAIAAAAGRGGSMLDIGTGTGILAIAAAKLGFKSVQAFDFDPVAVRVAKANARRNRAACSIHRADLGRMPTRSPKQFDLICANLIDTVLIEHAERLVHRLRPNGQLVLAGILSGQFAEVAKAYSALGLRLAEAGEGAGWKSATFEGTSRDPELRVSSGTAIAR